MSDERFVYGVIKGSRQAHIKDCHTCKSATIDVYDDDFKYFVDLLNELAEENEQLKYDNFMFKGVIKTFQKVAISERKKLEKEIEESKITIQLYETDVSMRDNFLKSKGLYDEFLQCILE